MRKQPKIRLKVDAFIQAAAEKGLGNNTEIAEFIGVTPTHIYRVTLPVSHHNYSPPGTPFIAGVLSVFGGPFERFFFVDSSLQPRNKKAI